MWVDIRARQECARLHVSRVAEARTFGLRDTVCYFLAGNQTSETVVPHAVIPFIRPSEAGGPNWR